MIKAYGYNLSESDIDRMRKMANILDENVEVYDLKSYEIKCNPDDIVFLYGSRAHKKKTKIECKTILEFPNPADITDTSEDGKLEREKAFKKIIKLKDVISSGGLDNNQDSIKLTEQFLPNLTANNISALAQQQKEKGKTYWEGITKDGKTIKVTSEPEEKTADINMTFTELYSVLGLIETFRLKELEIVYKSNLEGSSKESIKTNPR